MNYLDNFLFGYYPYICLTVFLLGSLIRFDRDQYTWKSDSSQLLRAGQLRWGSNLFHVGVLFLFFGHFFGMLTPHVVYEGFITAGAKQVVAMVEENKADENHAILQENLHLLSQMRLLNGKQLNIVELQMPKPVISEGIRLPASYANFYICNAAVIVPTFRCENDQKALDILTNCFPERKVVGIDSTEIIWGLGSFDCLSQEEPKV